ncbi:MAG: shikimate dehydrogenase [Betaproteobacteria bacterium]|jgi:shikimate dehydrogenase|nr:shikimate dehydrogenase [Betaproteobacteria bacterium]NBZ98994.1 shikimate dehydrogenase [Betaproteobacteria bacterium]NDD01013.1 shikimate dehydrogenase [Betaproteobacteria bacterium]NDD23088.1 shikimate dehydrogenase [Betaproteobacteria bacterium]NDE23810.1 shikimate dehydrogenase [Betaproteobacteria bacterium]
MDTYCVFGHPIEHSKSPWIHARFAQLTDQDLVYHKTLAPLDGFANSLHAFQIQGGKGCNVTLPFKTQAAALATHCSPRVSLAQACNTLKFDGSTLYGENTDGLGLVTDLVRNAGCQLKGQSILLMGAGGAAAGVLGPLLSEKPRQLWVCNRTVDKATQLVQRHATLAAEQGVDCQAMSLQHEGLFSQSFDVVINATSSSLQQGQVPVPPSVLQSGGMACDLMYGPAAQGFMQWATAGGAQARDGLGMLVEQAAESFYVWRGVRPPTAPVLAELRALLAPA